MKKRLSEDFEQELENALNDARTVGFDADAQTLGFDAEANARNQNSESAENPIISQNNDKLFKKAAKNIQDTANKDGKNENAVIDNSDNSEVNIFAGKVILSTSEEANDKKLNTADILKEKNFESEKTDCTKTETDNKGNAGNSEKSERTENKENKNDVRNENKKQEQRYGKFKTAEELLKAYGELEREFTRRAQKLAEYEKSGAEQTDLNGANAKSEAADCGEIAETKVKNDVSEVLNAENDKSERETGIDINCCADAENKRTAQEKSEKEWRSEVDKFFDETPSAKPFAKDIAKEILEHPELKNKPDCLFAALTRVLVSTFRTPEQLLSDRSVIEKYILNSDSLKNEIISDYLHSLAQGKPPAFMSDGGESGVAPKRNPRSIEEAGKMFLKHNK